MFYFDPLWMGIMILAMILGGGASLMTRGAFNHYKRVPASSGRTGAEAARIMLEAAGIYGGTGIGRGTAGSDGVRIERIGGFLSDHYDPRHKVLRLSPDVYDGRNVAALGVACHEAGHAIQHAKKYAPLTLRNAIVPVASIGSSLSWVLIFLGVLLMGMGMAGLGNLAAIVGVILFGTTVVFQIVNLPVEFDASWRAKKMLPQLGLISGPKEQAGVNRVLNAAAMTYVAATVIAAIQLLYWMYRLGLLGGRRD